MLELKRKYSCLTDITQNENIANTSEAYNPKRKFVMSSLSFNIEQIPQRQTAFATKTSSADISDAKTYLERSFSSYSQTRATSLFYSLLETLKEQYPAESAKLILPAQEKDKIEISLKNHYKKHFKRHFAIAQELARIELDEADVDIFLERKFVTKQTSHMAKYVDNLHASFNGSAHGIGHLVDQKPAPLVIREPAYISCEEANLKARKIANAIFNYAIFSYEVDTMIIARSVFDNVCKPEWDVWKSVKARNSSRSHFPSPLNPHRSAAALSIATDKIVRKTGFSSYPTSKNQTARKTEFSLREKLIIQKMEKEKL